MSREQRKPDAEELEGQTPDESELDEQAIDLPNREAMSIIKPSLFPLDLGGPLGPVGLPPGSAAPAAIPNTAPVPQPSPVDELA
jgi:hypothetical protein